jgi:hypothetical protein
MSRMETPTFDAADALQSSHSAVNRTLNGKEAHEGSVR